MTSICIDMFFLVFKSNVSCCANDNIDPVDPFQFRLPLADVTKAFWNTKPVNEEKVIYIFHIKSFYHSFF